MIAIRSAFLFAVLCNGCSLLCRQDTFIVCCYAHACRLVDAGKHSWSARVREIRIIYIYNPFLQVRNGKKSEFFLIFKMLPELTNLFSNIRSLRDLGNHGDVMNTVTDQFR